MRARNAAWVDPAPKYTAQQKTALQAFVAANGNPYVDFAAIRAAFPVGERAALTDGVIHQMCVDLGVKVEP